MVKIVFLCLLVLALTESVKYRKAKTKRELNRARASMGKRQATTCSENQFMCTSGECILAEWVCDTQQDCADGSDEKECQCKCRGEHKYQCHNGNCVPASFICDQDNDCGDGSDEIDCHLTTCRPEQVQCDNFKCIHESALCDGYDDCRNGWDERDCVPTDPNACRPWQVQCDNLACIDANWICDGDNDCGDMWDETDCGTLDIADVGLGGSQRKNIGFSVANAVVVCGILSSTGFDPSLVTIAPKYLKLLTVSKFSPPILMSELMPLGLFVISLVFSAFISIPYAAEKLAEVGRTICLAVTILNVSTLTGSATAGLPVPTEVTNATVCARPLPNSGARAASALTWTTNVMVTPTVRTVLTRPGALLPTH